MVSTQMQKPVLIVQALHSIALHESNEMLAPPATLNNNPDVVSGCWIDTNGV
jgi:hypothetical protein